MKPMQRTGTRIPENPNALIVVLAHNRRGWPRRFLVAFGRSVVAIRRLPVPDAAKAIRKRPSIAPVRIIAVVTVAAVRVVAVVTIAPVWVVAVVTVVVAAAVAPLDIFAFDVAALVNEAWSSPA
jgi:hypothetical protein